jgi:tRNA (cytidine/uridine-2'-O-)-methyltransferase
MIKIVLFAPEIPGNTGSIGRTCVALNFELILIKPLGFDLSEKALRRAGLDYWKHVKLKLYESWEDFLEKEKPQSSDLLFFEKDGKGNFFEAPYSQNSYLIFGRETSGFPQSFYEHYHNQMYFLPMDSSIIRSLNLSNTVTAVAYQALNLLR